MRKILALSLALVLILCLCNGCGNVTAARWDRYISYEHCDPHLTCLDVMSTGALLDLEQGLRFRRIKDVSDDQFIQAEELPKFWDHKYSFYAVWQNPDNRVDVLTDWTMEKMELYYVDRSEGISGRELRESKTEVIQSHVFSTSTDADAFAQLAILAEEDGVSNNTFEAPDGYKQEHNDIREEKEDENSYYLYIRVCFEESKSLVWDGEIRSYVSEDGTDRMFFVDMGKDTRDFSHSRAWVAIDEESALFEWLNAGLEKLAD